MIFRAGAVNGSDAAGGYRFATIATPGTTPRCWYYMLRDVDPRRSQYAAILIGAEDYDDEDYEDLSGREMDIRYLAPLLQWRDVIAFPASYPDWRRRGEALSTTVWKGQAFRADFQDLLVRHKYRMRAVEVARRESAAFLYNAEISNQSMSGLMVNWKSGAITYPPNLSAAQRDMIRHVLLREPAPQTGARGAYLTKWYGSVLDYYRGSTTRVIFLRLPRGPVVRPPAPGRKTAAVRGLARAHPNAILMPEDTFDILERGENFVDALHLNDRGSAEFSRMAARETARLLGPVRTR
jgi:PHD/YefM family antitoxin component YafN of YafNO toxin-antitoxin module